MDARGAPPSPGEGLGHPQTAARKWFEPLFIVCVMLFSLYINHRRSYSIIPDKTRPFRIRPATPSTDSLLDADASDDSDDAAEITNNHKRERCCGMSLATIGPFRQFENNIHSRILQKFPFLVEMFYWALNFVAYSVTKQIAGHIYGRSGDAVTALAQDNGIAILDIEQHSVISFLFPVREADFQAYFLREHKSVMTFFNQIYSLVHIPGTVAFISWYYYAAPNHATFALARRTMTLGNFAAFIIFCFYPCMPPRLLPESYGFKDTVRQDKAESVWVGGKNVNQLAAMPSLHFTYAFVIGCTFFYHSGLLQALQGIRTPARTPWSTIAFVTAGILYPALVLTVIVATANHYYLDALVATISVTLSLLANRVWMVLLPAESVLAWLLRVNKPTPTTGQRYSRDLRSRSAAVHTPV